ncbi:hypothetical protein [Nocardioides sp. SYSU D00038]|uniref:hypothetical protein n=1 Tax=Nocardioides sp. SYSU D00038 TaxID=2812554 RepID=UPI0019673157|nr:hypothetical protein [Nocardioides sp. SYSU D00038]
MSDHDDDRGEGRPVLTGVLALLGVGLVVGLVLSIITLVGVTVLGVGDDEADAGPTRASSFYLPEPVPTEEESGPLVTLEPSPTRSNRPDDDEDPTRSESPKTKISLSASDTSVSQMEQVTLSGVYPGGEGAILQVQRFDGGRWVDFAGIDANVSNETFSTYVQTSRTGVNRFRVVDSDTDLASNEVKFTVG